MAKKYICPHSAYFPYPYKPVPYQEQGGAIDVPIDYDDIGTEDTLSTPENELRPNHEIVLEEKDPDQEQ